MPSLYKTTYEIRLIFKWISILIGTLLVLYILFNVGSFVKEIVSPTPPPPPTVSFGKLPGASFQASLDGSKYSYTLDTVTGKLPVFSDRAKVYKLTSSQPNLLAIERAREKVNKAGFGGLGIALSSTKYQWDEPVSPYRKLVLEILNNNFDITSFYFQDENIKNPERLPTEQFATAAAKDLVEILAGFPLDIDEEKTKTTLYEMKNADIVAASSFSNAQIIRVDFFQKNVDDLKIYYEDPLFSTMSFLIGGGRSEGQIVEAHYFHHTTTEIFATYPIITTDEAWDMLKEGKAHIARYDGKDNTISIKNIELAYYLDDQKQDYMIPIIVIEGDDNFYAYIPAITKEFTESN